MTPKSLAMGLLASVIILSSSCKRATDNATPVGTPTGAAVSATIGASGGSLATADGSLRVNIPAGALAGPTQVSIQPITNQAHGGIGTAYRIEAHGSTRSRRASLVFTYKDGDLKGTAPGFLLAAFQREDRKWQVAARPVLDRNARTVTVETDHFSDWSLVPGKVLKPSEATVKVGESAYFDVMTCVSPSLGPTDLAPLLIPCTPKGLPEDVDPWEDASWEVNGVAGGNATTGTATSVGRGRGRFTAPHEVPQPDTVMVSARFKSSEQLPGGTEIVMSPVLIEEDPSQGQIIVTVNASCDANYKFSDGENTVNDHAAVNLNERSVYQIVKDDNGEGGTDLKLVSYRSSLSPSGGGTIQGPATEIPKDLLASSWKYQHRPLPPHPFIGLRLSLPKGNVQVGVWDNFAELLQAQPEQSMAGAGVIAVQTINDAEQQGTAYHRDMHSSFKPKAKNVSVSGHASHSYAQPGGLGSGRVEVNYSITGNVSEKR